MAEKRSPGNLELRIGTTTFFASGKDGAEVFEAIGSYAKLLSSSQRLTKHGYRSWFEKEAQARFGENYTEDARLGACEVIIDAGRKLLLYNARVDRKRDPAMGILKERGYEIVRYRRLPENTPWLSR